jgi:CyaY protein
MDEQGFDKLAGDELKRLDQALAAVAELEVDFNGDVITVELPDRSTFVINSHRAARQIWLSAEMSASHYSFDPQAKCWRDTKGGEELWARVEGALGRKLSRKVSLRLS